MPTVVRNYKYILLATIVGLSVLGFTILLPNLKLIGLVSADSSVSIGDKIGLFIALLGAIATNFTLLSALTTIIISLLVGVNVAFMLYLYRRQKAALSGSSVPVSVSGMTAGIFGVGCATCGSFILTGFLTAVGGIGILAILPFRGQEFGIIGVILLLYTTYFLAQKIIGPVTCEIK